MLVSIITPCFNEEENIIDCIERVAKVFSNELEEYEYEHIFIDKFSEIKLSVFYKNNQKIKILKFLGMPKMLELKSSCSTNIHLEIWY